MILEPERLRVHVGGTAQGFDALVDCNHSNPRTLRDYYYYQSYRPGRLLSLHVLSGREPPNRRVRLIMLDLPSDTD